MRLKKENRALKSVECCANFGLLAHFGAESAGALTLLVPDEEQAEGGEAELTFEALSARIQKLSDSPLSTGASKRMPLAGAQHKLPVIYRGGRLYEAKAERMVRHEAGWGVWLEYASGAYALGA